MKSKDVEVKTNKYNFLLHRLSVITVRSANLLSFQCNKGNEEVETCNIPMLKDFDEINFNGPPVIKVLFSCDKFCHHFG